ncbi:hypothetical protein A4H97_33835 [Niastella yeongjuensis]|uniref:RHS repeat-associated core domain-containing protein n=1 Tax=Niastella yeongjuensis TaxID=354355 RepID=A0A1V9EBW8_9BACT|nr:RHS repeat-associated core domain-containing protein [Niastella yeongjuensis]OQP43609.1 hypothetical protein A4H97_33835 [Niastella yeongjuensis]SEP28974.1 RHS repeat-associated core domain-containing protein [Niastella yeongjuensis]
MKKLLLLISFIILFLYSFTQTDVQRDNRVNPVLKSALAARSGYYIYGSASGSSFINIAVLNQATYTLCWFTCHGRLFDSTKLTAQEFEQVTSKQVDPFLLYQNICDKYLTDIAAAKDVYRVYGDIQLFDKLNGNYRALFAMETVQAAKTRLQKLIAIENIRKKILTQLTYLNCVSPFNLQDAPLYKISKEQAGVMIQSQDSTVYYNVDPTSAVAKISLYKKSAGQLYVQNRFSEIIDSVALQPEKYDLLQKEKVDVFLLYRGWLEMQWQGTLSAIRRQSARLYNQVSVQSEKEVKELYSQLNAIGAKINQLSLPEAKSIEQAVCDTYKNEKSEIAYMPLLGIAYELIEKRGQKEYELTNHLGNVLVTVTDKKIGVPSGSGSSLIDHYEPDIVSAQDYYPFGMLQPGRSYLSPNGDKYRYGFNGKENDNEVKGDGNQQDYGMRVYDPRLGKFLSVDPLTTKFPELTPYQFASNSPIVAIDLDGAEWTLPNWFRWRFPKIELPQIYIPAPPTIPLPPIVIPNPVNSPTQLPPTTLQPSIPEWESIDLTDPNSIKIPGSDLEYVPDAPYVPSWMKENGLTIKRASAYRPGEYDDAEWKGGYKDKKTGKELKGGKSKDDVPEWARGYRPRKGEKGEDFSKRLLDKKYGPGNWKKGPATEFNKIKKFGDSDFKTVIPLPGPQFQDLKEKSEEYNKRIKEAKEKVIEQTEQQNEMKKYSDNKGS